MAALPRIDDSQTTSSGNEVEGVGNVGQNENNKPASECIASYNNSLNNNVLTARGGAPLGQPGRPEDQCGEVVDLQGASSERFRGEVVVKTKGAMKFGDDRRISPMEAPCGVLNQSSFASEDRLPEDEFLHNRILSIKDSSPKTTPTKINLHKSSSASSTKSSSISRKGL